MNLKVKAFALTHRGNASVCGRCADCVYSVPGFSVPGFLKLYMGGKNDRNKICIHSGVMRVAHGGSSLPRARESRNICIVKVDVVGVGGMFKKNVQKKSALVLDWRT